MSPSSIYNIILTREVTKLLTNCRISNKESNILYFNLNFKAFVIKKITKLSFSQYKSRIYGLFLCYEQGDYYVKSKDNLDFAEFFKNFAKSRSLYHLSNIVLFSCDLGRFVTGVIIPVAERDQQGLAIFKLKSTK